MPKLDLDALQEQATAFRNSELSRMDITCDELIALIDRLRKAEAALNPRRWTAEMNKAWHTTIPDTAKAFERLREIATTPDSADSATERKP